MDFWPLQGLGIRVRVRVRVRVRFRVRVRVEVSTKVAGRWSRPHRWNHREFLCPAP